MKLSANKIKTFHLPQVYRYCRGHLKIRFRKLNHNILIPKPKISDDEPTDEETNDSNVAKMRYFRKFTCSWKVEGRGK